MPCGAVSRLESETRSVLLRGTGKLPRVRQAVMKDKSLFPQKRGKRAQDFITLSQSRANAIKRRQTRNKKRLMPPLGGCKGGRRERPLCKKRSMAVNLLTNLRTHSQSSTYVHSCLFALIYQRPYHAIHRFIKACGLRVRRYPPRIRVQISAGRL